MTYVLVGLLQVTSVSLVMMSGIVNGNFVELRVWDDKEYLQLRNELEQQSPDWEIAELHACSDHEIAYRKMRMGESMMRIGCATLEEISEFCRVPIFDLMEFVRYRHAKAQYMRQNPDLLDDFTRYLLEKTLH